MDETQWLLLQPLIPAEKSGGRHRSVDMREVLNAIFYLLRSGCAWRLLPHDFPKWQTVYGYFRQWRKDQVWEKMNAALREAVREQEGRAAEPSAGSMDSQSVKTTAVAGERGYDGAKKLTGRKRHILVDTIGLLLMGVVTKASVAERAGGKRLLQRAVAAGFQRLALIWADGGYAGKPFFAWALEHCGWLVEIVKRSDDAQGFVLLPRRWVVERTFGWLLHFRRLSKDYEVLPETSESMIYAAMVCLMLKRLARNPAVYL
jgi:putative transposase